MSATLSPARTKGSTASAQSVPAGSANEPNQALISPPSAYICPITADVMRDPVSTIDGYCYEREAIEKWFSCHDTSPMTNLALKSKSLTPQVPPSRYIVFVTLMRAPKLTCWLRSSCDKALRSGGSKICQTRCILLRLDPRFVKNQLMPLLEHHRLRRTCSA